MWSLTSDTGSSTLQCGATRQGAGEGGWGPFSHPAGEPSSRCPLHTSPAKRSDCSGLGRDSGRAPGGVKPHKPHPVAGLVRCHGFALSFTPETFVEDLGALCGWSWYLKVRDMAPPWSSVHWTEPGRQGAPASWMELGVVEGQGFPSPGLGVASAASELRVAHEDGETVCLVGAPRQRRGAGRGVSSSRCRGEFGVVLLSGVAWGGRVRTAGAHAFLGRGRVPSNEVCEVVSGGGTCRESRQPGDVPVS